MADDGGSSGRLRRELDCLPPGDLRMALAALCGDDESGRTWADVLQYRFRSTGPLDDHAIGNLLIVGLWERLGDPVAGLDMVARLLGAKGRVLPMASVPLDIAAEVIGLEPDKPDEVSEIRGQARVAKTPGEVCSVRLIPQDPPASPESIEVVLEADWIVLGPGSWFTSVIPHLLVPKLAEAIHATAPGASSPSISSHPARRRDSRPRSTLSCLPTMHQICGSMSYSPTVVSPRMTRIWHPGRTHWGPGSWSPTSVPATARRDTTHSA